MAQDLTSLYKVYKDFDDIILNTCLASLAIYENNPIEFLKTNEELYGIQHELTNICNSREYKDTDNVKIFNDLHKIKYLISKNETKKRIIVAFRGTDNVSDFMDDLKFYSKISDSNGRIHAGFYKRAQNVPIEYFFDQLVNDYQVIFTGHSLGATTAAIITIKLLRMLNMTEQMAKNILFIGFGCPSITDMYFKNEIEIHFKDRFIFIKNKQDIVVEILDYLAILVYDSPSGESGIFNNLSLIGEFVKNVLSISINGFNINKLTETCKNYSKIIRPIAKLGLPNYQQFGTLLQIEDNNKLKKVEKFQVDKTEMESLFKNADTLINKCQNHFIRNYFLNLKIPVFQHRIDMKTGSFTRHITTFTDLSTKIKEIDNSRIFFTKYENDANIYLTVDMENENYLTGAKLVIETSEFKTYEKPTKGTFKFTCRNELIFSANKKVLKQNLKLKLYTHFSQDPIEHEIEESKLPHEIKDEFTQKYVQIQDMPFDLLYLHAAYYINLVGRMEKNEGINEETHEFTQIKNKLLNLFDQIDKEAELGERNKLDEEELATVLESHLKYHISDYEKQNNSFSDIYKNIEFCIAKKGLKKLILENCTKPNSSEELLKCMIPYVNEIKKKVCRSSFESDSILEKIILYDTDASTKLDTLKSKLQDLARTLAIKNIPMALYFAKYLKRDQLKGETDNILYKLILKLNLDPNKNNLNLGDFEKSFDDNFISSWKNEPDKKNFKIFQLNAQMRDIFLTNVLVGVIGTKKAGKSTFVELIKDGNTNASATESTVHATPYTLSNQLALIDYPHFNSSKLSEKVEFHFTRMLLDHMILIFDAKMKGETNDEKLLYNLVMRKNFQNYTILHNHADFLFLDHNFIDLAEFKSKLCENLEVTQKDKLHLTCLAKEIDNLKKMDQMISCSVVLRDELVGKFNQIIADIIKLNEHKNNQLKFDLSKYKNLTKKPITSKKILVTYKTREIMYTLKLDSTTVRDDENDTIFAVFNDLIEEINYSFRLNGKNVKILSRDDKPMESIEDFFNDKSNCFRLNVK